MTYIPPPRNLKAFPFAKRVKPKTTRKRWKEKSYIYEWDSLHGRVEKYDKKGNHLGEFNSVTGEETKPADSSRKIQP